MTTADFEDFFRRYYRERILELARGYPEEGRALVVEWDDLYQFDPDLADSLRRNPNRLLADAREALRTFDVPVDVDLGEAEVYIAGFPTRTQIRDIRAEHVNTLVSVRGIVRKATPVRPKVEVAIYECLTCGGEMEVVQRGQELREPNRCHHCERNTQLERMDDRSRFVDAQRLRIQESPEGLRGGETPQNIDVHLETDLTGVVSPGDRVTATGILKLREQSQGGSTSPILDVYLEGNFIDIEEEEFEVMSIEDEDIDEIRDLAAQEDIYDRVVDSIAPSIWGYEDEKFAMALQLFSGVRKPLPDGSRVRGDIHVLLVGDPGTGKSQLLQYITKIAPRSVYTSGKGSSAAGLTAAAIRDDFGDGQQWTLEAGALVLADQGIAAVDELDKMRPEDRSAMHEALEQQSVSVSKAGINATLQARCALLGAANPKYGRFDQYEPIPEQIELEPALISRFDLIFTVDDLPDQDRDERIAEHILKTNYAGELNTRQTTHADEAGLVQKIEEATEEVTPAIEPELLRKYVAYATQTCIPTMTMEAREAIKEFYLDLREQGVDEDSPVPMTARKLEALVRLAEASARIRLAEEVTKEDAERVIELVRASMGDIGFDPETGAYDVDMIETGTPKTQRDRIKSLKQLMEHLEEEYDEGIPMEVLIEEAEERGMEADRIEHEIDKMKQSGEIYEPSSNRFRLA